MHQSRQGEAVWIMPRKIQSLFFNCAAYTIKHRLLKKNSAITVFSLVVESAKGINILNSWLWLKLLSLIIMGDEVWESEPVSNSTWCLYAGTGRKPLCSAIGEV